MVFIVFQPKVQVYLGFSADHRPEIRPVIRPEIRPEIRPRGGKNTRPCGRAIAMDKMLESHQEDPEPIY